MYWNYLGHKSPRISWSGVLFLDKRRQYLSNQARYEVKYQSSFGERCTDIYGRIAHFCFVMIRLLIWRRGNRNSLSSDLFLFCSLPERFMGWLTGFLS